MKNAKIYKEKRKEHENASELFDYEHYNRYSFYPSYCMTPENIKDLRSEFKNDIKYRNAFKLSNCNDRAIVICIDNNDGTFTYQLKSYTTIVAEIEHGRFKKIWEGYSNTTLKHINRFREWYGMNTISKYEWIMMECE